MGVDERLGGRGGGALSALREMGERHDLDFSLDIFPTRFGVKKNEANLTSAGAE